MEITIRLQKYDFLSIPFHFFKKIQSFQIQRKTANSYCTDYGNYNQNPIIGKQSFISTLAMFVKITYCKQYTNSIYYIVHITVFKLLIMCFIT